MERVSCLIAIAIVGCSGRPFSEFHGRDAGAHEGSASEVRASERPASSAGEAGGYAGAAAGAGGSGALSARGDASGASGGTGSWPTTDAGAGGTGGADDGAGGGATAGTSGQSPSSDAGQGGSSSDGGMDLRGCSRIETTGPCNSQGYDNLYECPPGESPQNFMRVLCTLRIDDPKWRCCSDNIEGGQMCQSVHDCDVTCEVEAPCCDTSVARCGCGGGKTCEPKL